MFKRVERRQRRKAKEEELGLDEDTKEFLGLQDTDSDESNSSEEDSSGDEQDAFQSDQNAEVSDDDGVINHQDLSKYAGMDEEQDIPAVTVEQALHDPVFTHLSNPDWSCCILCPGKVLKGKEPAKIHIESHAHLRRAKRFRNHVESESIDLELPAFDIVKNTMNTKVLLPVLGPASESNRSKKKKARRLILKAKFEERRKLRRAGQSLANLPAIPAVDIHPPGSTNSGPPSDSILHTKKRKRRNELPDNSSNSKRTKAPGGTDQDPDSPKKRKRKP